MKSAGSLFVTNKRKKRTFKEDDSISSLAQRDNEREWEGQSGYLTQSTGTVVKERFWLNQKMYHLCPQTASLHTVGRNCTRSIRSPFRAWSLNPQICSNRTHCYKEKLVSSLSAGGKMPPWCEWNTVNTSASLCHELYCLHSFPMQLNRKATICNIVECAKYLPGQQIHPLNRDHLSKGQKCQQQNSYTNPARQI